MGAGQGIYCPPMGATFATAERIVTGWGCVEQLGELASGHRRALLVTGRSALRSAGTTDRLAGLLESSGAGVCVFDQAEPEPSVATVDRGRERLREEGCDLVVAAGGGSAVDVGKAIAGLAGEAEATGAYFTGRPSGRGAVAWIGVPTTSGTGAEVTNNSVLTDPAQGLKQSIRPLPMPAAAIVDPELTVSCPPEVTASSGMDALVQAIESYLSRHATPLTDALAVQAVRLIRANLPTASRDGRDRAAREAMAYGSLLAGMALSNARLGAVHGMAHPIGYRCHIAHGVVCAALLPAVLRFNREAAGRKYEVLADIFGGDPADASAELLRALGLPDRLGPLGLSAGEFEAIAAESMPSGSLKANPRKVTEADVEALLRQVL